MTAAEIKRIAEALWWYEGTDGSEKEDAALEMYSILKQMYDKEIKKRFLKKT